LKNKVMAYGPDLLKTLYFHSPLILKTSMTTVYGMYQRHQRYGPTYFSYLNFLKESQYLPYNNILEYRNRNTISFINEAIKSTPWYGDQNKYFDIDKIDDIKKFQILTKNDVRNNQKSLISTNISKMCHKWSHTSGTSGKALVFPISQNCFQREYAFRGLHYEWGGVVLKGHQPFAFCAGHPVTHQNQDEPPFWVYDHANNWLLLSSYHLSEKNLIYYIRELDRFSPVLLGGYPSSLYLLAMAYKKYGNGDFKPRCVFSSSETLLTYQRIAIQEAFDSKVLNWYGSSEIAANIVECEKGELHLKHEHSFVEVLDEQGRECNPGETGRLICTAFGNIAFPLIRYDIGDTVTLSSFQTSKCGRNGLLVDRIEGRKEDYIFTPEGKMIGRLDHLFKDSVNVFEAQIIQYQPDEITIRIVKTEQFAKSDENQILKEAKLRLGSNIKIKFDYCDQIERGPNGKFRFIVSKINQEEAIKNIMNI